MHRTHPTACPCDATFLAVSLLLLLAVSTAGGTPPPARLYDAGDFYVLRDRDTHSQCNGDGRHSRQAGRVRVCDVDHSGDTGSRDDLRGHEPGSQRRGFMVRLRKYPDHPERGGNRGSGGLGLQ